MENLRLVAEVLPLFAPLVKALVGLDVGRHRHRAPRRAIRLGDALDEVAEFDAPQRPAIDPPPGGAKRPLQVAQRVALDDDRVADRAPAFDQELADLLECTLLELVPEVLDQCVERFHEGLSVAHRRKRPRRVAIGAVLAAEETGIDRATDQPQRRADLLEPLARRMHPLALAASVRAREAIESDVDALADDPPDVRRRVFVLIQLERHYSPLNSAAWMKFSTAEGSLPPELP